MSHSYFFRTFSHSQLRLCLLHTLSEAIWTLAVSAHSRWK